MGSLLEKLHYLDCTAIGDVTATSRLLVGNQIGLWHQRLRHLKEQQLKEMISQDLVKGMNIPKTVRLSFCEKCVQGNSQWERFIRLGNYNLCIDSDVCGPLFMESIGGKNTL